VTANINQFCLMRITLHNRTNIKYVLIKNKRVYSAGSAVFNFEKA